MSRISNQSRTRLSHSSVSDHGADQERWLVSYADFMTLLMAFFVVMYSISSVSEQKYRVLSNTFSGAFNTSNDAGMISKQVQGDPLLSDHEIKHQAATPIEVASLSESAPNMLTALTAQLDKDFQSLIGEKLITLSGNEHWLQIELQSAILFDVGGALIHHSAEPIIKQISTMLMPYGNVVKVEGFTDNTPISNSTFDSNWELSTARATAVVRLMIAQGVEANRLAAVGYGEYQPAVSNDTSEGRAKNRRIVLMISTSDTLRPQAHEIMPVDYNLYA
ncbi:MAG: flagellar motor protein MotB, partial [Pseudomonadota bacterium]|nr:flagellar motor protein MotB [Pseudomonadota bacterium]